jgi:hypothetical protein
MTLPSSLTRRGLCRLALVAAALVPLASAPARADGPPPEVRLSLSEYEALMAKARQRGGAIASFSTATGTVSLPDPEQTGGAASVSLTADLNVNGDGIAEVPLLPAHVVITSATFVGSRLSLTQRDGMHVAIIPGSGARAGSLSLSWRVPVRAGSDGANLAVVPMPPVAGFTFDLDGTTTTPVDVWPGREGLQPGDEVQLGAAAAFVARWGGAADVVRRIDYRVVIDPGSDGATVEAKIEVFVEGPRALVPLMPAHIALVDVREDARPLPTRVVGDQHRAVVTGAGRHVITAEYRMGIDRSQGQPQLTLPTPRAPMTRIEARVPGKRTVQVLPAVPVTQRIDGDDPNATTTAIAHLPPTDSATLSWTEPRSAPEQVTSVNTETYQLVKIEEGVLRSKVEVRYEIIRGSLKELVLELPPEAVLYRVAGEGIEDWRTFAATDDAPRQARVFLGAEQEGTYKLELELEQVAPQTVGQQLSIPVVRPLGAAREMGVVALFDGSRVGFAEATTEGYVRSGEDALPTDVRQKLAGDIVTQAFKHIGPPAPISTAVAAARTREIRFDVHVESLYTFQQNALTAHSSITVDVKSGRTDRVIISLPKGVKVGSDVSAPSLKKADWVEGGDEEAPRRDFEILLTRALEGTFRIELSLELILGSELGALELPDIRVMEADVKKGDFGIASDPGMEVDQKEAVGLRKLDAAELPNSVRLRSRREVQLGYSYSWVDEPWRLSLDVRRHKTVETLTASVSSGRLVSTILAEGEVVHVARWTVDNKDRPWLRLKLPEGARVLGVLVGGERAEPIADDSGALKIQLRKQTTADVEIAWMDKRDPFGLLGGMSLVAPRPDVFMTDFAWLVRVPTKLTVASSSTDLPELDAAAWDEAPSGLDGLVRLPDDTDFTNRAFKADVIDADDARVLELSLTVVKAPRVLGGLVFVLGFALLALALWRRLARGAGLRPFAVLAVAGLVVTTLGALVWGIGGGPAALFILSLGLVAFFAWLKAREAVSP